MSRLITDHCSESFLNRREMLRLTGATAAAALVGCVHGESSSQGSTGSGVDGSQKMDAAKSETPSCIVRPQQTEGPYFVEGRLNRSDIRSDPTNGSVSAGDPLSLILHVSRIDGSACRPVKGAIVDLWQCDALGVYSDFQDFNGLFDTRGKKFLRGFQTTDPAGKAQFVTIYPGWYPGRTVHIHFKIRTNPAEQRGSEFTSQLYFDDLITDQVHAQAPYNTRGQRRQRNERDGIFRSGGKDLMLQLKKDAQGYVGTFDIGLRVA